MEKKFTSWGVSFASLALFAGMMSYMGFTKKDTTTVAQSQVTTQGSTQQSQSNSNQDSSVTYEVPSQSTDTSQTTDTSQSQQSSDQSVSEDSSFPSQHGGFDTTTGGT